MTTASLLTLSTENRPELCRLFFAARTGITLLSREPLPFEIRDALNALPGTVASKIFFDRSFGNWSLPRTVEPFAALTTAIMISTILASEEKT